MLIQLTSMQLDFTDRKLPDKAAERRQAMKQMAKDTVTATVIGTLATYLPFWQWDGTRWMGAIVLGVVAWCALVAMEPEKENDHFRDLTKMHR